MVSPVIKSRWKMAAYISMEKWSNEKRLKTLLIATIKAMPNATANILKLFPMGFSIISSKFLIKNPPTI